MQGRAYILPLTLVVAVVLDPDVVCKGPLYHIDFMDVFERFVESRKKTISSELMYLAA